MLPPRRNIYDRLSEKRLADLERQRVVEAQLPKGNFTSGSVAVVNAWVWLPCGVFDTPLSADELALRRADFDHDPRLVDSRSLRRPLRRLDTPAVRSPSVNAAGRAARFSRRCLLSGMRRFVLRLTGRTLRSCCLHRRRSVSWTGWPPCAGCGLATSCLITHLTSLRSQWRSGCPRPWGKAMARPICCA